MASTVPSTRVSPSIPPVASQRIDFGAVLDLVQTYSLASMPTAFARYGLAVVSAALTVLLKLQYPVIGERAPFLMGSLPVVLSAAYGGFGPGLLAGGLVTLGFGYFFVPPLHSFKVGPEGAVGMAAFSLQAILISWLLQGCLRSEAALRKLNAQLEERVQKRTTQLEAANRELEAFAYSASHDLRNPVTKITGFTQILLAEYAGKLDETAQAYLRGVEQVGADMANLIEDLLELSVAQGAELRREPINLSGLGEAVVQELRQSEPERQITVAITPGLTAIGDKGLVQIVLRNLLGNAWKFTTQVPQPEVRLGAVERDGSRTYFVGDNGVGFDMGCAGQLFRAFQRLHDRSQFPGTGIGLATVRRIIQRHGGHVWAEAALGRGATFYFTL